MESSDLLDLTAEPAAAAPPAMKRELDSLDDFEHLDRDQHAPARESDFFKESPLLKPTPVAAVQSFLDTEREETTVAPPPRAAAVDHLADKFTDSESEADASGESPRRAVPAPPPVPPHAAPLVPTPAPVPVPAPVNVPTSAPAPPELKSVPASEPVSIAAPTPVSAPAPTPAAVATPAPVMAPPLTPVSVSAPTPAPASRPAERPPAPPPVVSQPKRAPSPHVIEAEVIFCQMGLDAWFNPERLHPKVESLIYWRCPARSGAALGAGLAVLLALACCSVVSVLAYVSLLTLAGTVAFRIYKNVLQAVQKTSEGHPFKWLLDTDISLPAERSQEIAAAATAHANAAAHELRRLFLVEDLIDSLKFGVVLWSLTYVGACFNGITLFILGYVALFTLPKAYEANKAQVDANLELARAKINEITAKVRAAVPLGKKSDSDKDK